MRLTVFGASGKVGQLVTKRLLKDGHDVIVFVHKSSPFKETEQLTIIRGDIHNIDDVRGALTASQAVICTLGSWGTKSKDIVSSGMENILTAMPENKIKRVVSLTGSDAVAAGDRSGMLDNILRAFIYYSPARKILADGEKHIKLMENSKLDWTIVRSPVMNNKGAASNFILSQVKPKFWETINRQSVADAMVSILEDKYYYKKAPFIKRGEH